MSYEVGYGKPPVHSRFRKGQSGNPGGRPGPRRAAERLVQAELEELLVLSPEEFARCPPRDGFADIAADLTRGAVGGNAAGVRLLLSFLSERGQERPRRARLPARIRQKLDLAMSQGISQAIAENTQSQGITPAHPAQGLVSPEGSRGGAECAQAARPTPVLRNLRELRRAQERGSASQGIMCREPAALDGSHRAAEGTELPCSSHSAASILREIRSIRGPPCELSI
jgi:hypothetical protein